MSFPLAGSHRLEGDASAQLATARSDCDATTLSSRIDFSEVVSAQSMPRETKTGVVKDIDPIGAQLQAHPLSEFEVLGQRKVEYNQPRTAEGVSDFVSEGERSCRSSKRRRVEPLTGIRIAHMNAAYNVREPVTAIRDVAARRGSTHVATAGVLGVVVRSIDHRKGISTLAINVPASLHPPTISFIKLLL